MNRPWRCGVVAGLALVLVLTARPEAAAGEHRVPVTVVHARAQLIERWEPAVGELEAVTSPTVAAEVGGRVVGVEAEVGDRIGAGELLARIDAEDYRLAKAAAEAEVQRLEALLKAQRLQVGRLRSLVRGRSASQSDLDDAQAQLDALRAQLLGARVKLQQAERDLARTRVASPVDGRIDERMVSVGDYVQVGAPLFAITRVERLRARLPYPESLAGRLRRGLPVRLQSPMEPERRVEARVTELRPRIQPGNRAIEVLVDVDNPGSWEPGASVTGQVRTLHREHAVVVPEQAVVRRPAGTVVYVVQEGVAHQRIVQLGEWLPGWIEIRQGLRAGEPVVADGAGFLTDGAPVEVQEPGRDAP